MYKVFQGKDFCLDFSRRAYVMGILNVTPDSFSDGSRFFQPDLAIKRALQMQEEGADVLDIGGESTRPGFEPVWEAEELRRVIPVLTALKGRISIPISVDTTKYAVAKASVEAGASIINDVSELADIRLAELAAETGAGYILMHASACREQSAAQAVRSVLLEKAKKAEAAGLARASICLDVGIGFGKTQEQNMECVRRLSDIMPQEYGMLVGASRKSMIRSVLGDLAVEDKLYPTLAVHLLAAENGANLLRVHDVRAHVLALRMQEALLQGKNKESESKF